MLARWLAAAVVLSRAADDGCGSTATPSEPPVDAAPDTARTPRPGDPCTTRADCDDGVFCSGAEECLAGVCVSARNAACRAPSVCASVSCDESASACVFAAQPCEGLLVCSIDRGCVDNTCSRNVDCDDGRACTDDVCVAGHCAHVPIDARCPNPGACGVGVCLGDAISDASGCGSKPDAARCKPNEGCAVDQCVALKSSCTRDADCANGNLCDGVERCASGSCTHGARTTCTAGPCQHAECSASGVGDPWCRIVTLARCP